MPAPVVTYLQAVDDIFNRFGWVKVDAAVDEKGQPVQPESKAAVAFCFAGACNRVDFERPSLWAVSGEAQAMLRRVAADYCGFQSVMVLNDARDTDLQRVRDCIQEAIRRVDWYG